jgi:hypothetical protein
MGSRGAHGVAALLAREAAKVEAVTGEARRWRKVGESWHIAGGEKQSDRPKLPTVLSGPGVHGKSTDSGRARKSFVCRVGSLPPSQRVPPRPLDY